MAASPTATTRVHHAARGCGPGYSRWCVALFPSGDALTLLTSTLKL